MKKADLKDISTIVSDELTSKSIDLSVEYSEIALDEFLKEGLLKEIPIVKSVVTFYNIGNSVLARYNTKKIRTFFKEFHGSDINSESLLKFKSKFNSDSKYRTQVVETIILFNERFNQIEKSKILAKLILSHIEGHISWEELIALAIVLENIHPNGIIFLKSKMTYQGVPKHDHEGEPLMIACGIGYSGVGMQSPFKINKLGLLFYEFGVK